MLASKPPNNGEPKVAAYRRPHSAPLSRVSDDCFTRLMTGAFRMGEIVNLRKVRKQARKQEDAERAAANRISHGRTKVERNLEATRAEKIRRLLDAHKVDKGDAR